eukprot:scaffold41313_cov16-Tisochrysis_lutea.AAC.2
MPRRAGSSQSLMACRGQPLKYLYTSTMPGFAAQVSRHLRLTGANRSTSSASAMPEPAAHIYRHAGSSQPLMAYRGHPWS